MCPPVAGNEWNRVINEHTGKTVVGSRYPGIQALPYSLTISIRGRTPKFKHAWWRFSTVDFIPFYFRHRVRNEETDQEGVCAEVFKSEQRTNLNDKRLAVGWDDWKSVTNPKKRLSWSIWSARQLLEMKGIAWEMRSDQKYFDVEMRALWWTDDLFEWQNKRWVKMNEKTILTTKKKRLKSEVPASCWKWMESRRGDLYRDRGKVVLAGNLVCTL
jgi:hypothetical protein